MKKSLKFVMAIVVLLLTFVSNAQIKNEKTETVKIYGNCEMCENTIENVGNMKKIAVVDWKQDTQMATLAFDTLKTSKEEILKKIALAGYDNELFLAPDDTYANLPKCCHYERAKKGVAVMDERTMEMETSNPSANNEAMTEESQLSKVFHNYFALKDALVKTNSEMAAASAKTLLQELNAVQMDKLSMEVHMVWMKVVTELKEDAEHIATTEEVSHQRDHFMSLSTNMYTLLKVAKTETPTYYQFCPMANDGKGANWLSKEETVKNPYYGATMLGCGKTVETID